MLEVSIEWLATGRGFKNIQYFLNNENPPFGYTEKQKEFLTLFDQLPNDWKDKQLLTLKAVVMLLED